MAQQLGLDDEKHRQAEGRRLDSLGDFFPAHPESQNDALQRLLQSPNRRVDMFRKQQHDSVDVLSIPFDTFRNDDLFNSCEIPSL